MFVFFSKLLPVFVYPFGLAILLLLLASILKPQTQKRMRLWRIPVMSALALLWIPSTAWVSTPLIRSLEWRYLPPAGIPHAEVIVVLGGSTQSALPPRPLVELNGAADRLVYAAWLYHQGAAAHLLLTGGDIAWIGTADTPAQDMAAILAMLGVPDEALWLESESRNTYENALFTRRILAARGTDRIILVTSAIHMPRAVGLFERQGFEVIPAPTDYSVTQDSWQGLWQANFATQLFNLLPGASGLENTTMALKEYLGIIVYRLRGWL
jgi:uncharacterized SAM-binding protein YcdF (DUF218 family)